MLVVVMDMIIMIPEKISLVSHHLCNVYVIILVYDDCP
jgi:hypothetical protein